ncbi:MAG: response regulator [bacterium]
MEQLKHSEKATGAVLVADDVDIMRTTCKRALEKEGYEVIAAASGREALKKMPEAGVDVAVLDIRMPGISGVDLLRKIKTDWPETEIIMMTAYSDAEIAEESLNLGAAALLTKPFEDIDVLRKAVRKSMARVKLRRGQEHEHGPCFVDVLKESGLVNEHELKRAQEKAEQEGVTLREALSAMDILSQEDQDGAVANYLDIP